MGTLQFQACYFHPEVTWRNDTRTIIKALLFRIVDGYSVVSKNTLKKINVTKVLNGDVTE